MKRSIRLIAFILSIIYLFPALSGCINKPSDAPGTTTDVTTPADTTKAEEIGEDVEVSADGKVNWTLLGVECKKSFGGVTAADGKTLIVVYFEARNKSTDNIYISKNCLDTDPEPIEISADNLPENYSEFGGMITSGKRRLYCLCFEEKENWHRIIVDYISADGGMSNLIVAKDHVGKDTEILLGNPAYPLDTYTNENIATDFNKLYSLYYNEQWGTPNENTVQTHLKQLVASEDGSYFKNVNYNSDSKSNWDTINHLNFLKILISAYGEERLKNDAEARKTVLSVLDYWLNKDITCSVNWWYNEISAPRYMAAIGLMLSPYLSEDQISKMDKVIGRGTLRGSSKATTYTGGNLSDMMAITIMHGLFIDDPDLIFAAVSRMASEITVVPYGKEGIQEDLSFFQHGTLICTAGSYGTEFVKGMRTFITKLHGTCFALPESKIKLFIDHLLDGQQYFHRANGTTYFSIGRSAVYANGSSTLGAAAADLAKIDGIYRQAELKAYAESFSDHSKSIDDIKYFPLAYTLIKKSPEYYIGVKGAHENLIMTESINKQNTLGYNLSYGSNTCYMYYGDEYQTIGAVLDFAMFPGITTYHEDDTRLMERYNNEYKKTWAPKVYKGTHCDGKADPATGLGALYMELKNDGITGKLSYIMYDGGMIALAAGLNCSKTSNTVEIRTSLDQCKLNSASVGGTPLTLNAQETTVNGGTAVCNGAFAYYNLGEGSIIASAKRMSGSYKRSDLDKQNVTVEADVFSLYISHGTTLNSSSYAYAVAANADGKAPKDSSGLPIKNIINTEKVQAVEFTDGHYVIVFHEGGEITLSSGKTVKADGAKIIIE